jgi:hypothetical protein
MARYVLATLVALSLFGACAPTQAHEAADASIAPSPTATATATAPVSASPAIRASIAPLPLPTAPPDAVETVLPSGSAKSDDKPLAEPVSVTLATAADFVPQYTFEWCVGASIQMARSIITGDRDESRRTQRRVWEMARDRSVSPYGGANPAGWAAALNDLDLGPYRLVSRPSFDDALRTAARAIEDTGRPVGLVMWAGRHAWMMTGFESTGNLDAKGATVTRVRVMDPLYPHGSRWGPSPSPNSLMQPAILARQFVERDRPDYDFGVDPGWLLVLPVD